MKMVENYYEVTAQVKDPDRPTHWDRTILNGATCVFLHEVVIGENFYFCANYGNEYAQDWHTIRTTKVLSFNVNVENEKIVSVEVETKNTIYRFERVEA